MPQILTMKQAAGHVGVSVATLRRWRYEKAGPRSALIGGQVRYRRSDVESWLDEQFDKEVA